MQKYHHNQELSLDLAEKKQTRILWGFVHESARSEELPRFFKAGFEVIPIKILASLRIYEGENYDDETKLNYPKWRENCTLPKSIADRIREIDLYSTSHEIGNITKEDFKILNQYIGIIYVNASVGVSLALLKNGYKGIILFRYFGHYGYGISGVNHTNPPKNLVEELSLYGRILYCPALHSLIKHEDPLIGRKDKTAYIGYLVRKKSDFAKFIWKGKKSEALLCTAISMASTNLFHYYENFIKYFGNLPYKIFGKNTKGEMQSRSLVDDGIVGQLENASDVYE